MSEARIPIPWSQRWKRIRYQSLPIVIFTFSVIATGWLWTRFVGQPNVVGEVFAMRADAISRGDGILVDVPGTQLEVMHQVSRGDVIARIDPRMLLAQLTSLKGDLAAVEAKLDETTEATRFDQLDREVRHDYEARALATDIEQSRVTRLTLQAAIAADKIELQGLDQVLKLTEDGVEKKALTRLALVTAKKDRDIVAQRITGAERTLVQTRDQLVRALARQKQHSVLPKPDLDKLLAPIQAEITAKQALVDQIELQIAALEVKAPLDGTIVAVLRRPGQAVKIGDPIMTIAGNEGKFIVSYIRQSRNLRPEPNMAVFIRPRRIPRQAVVSEIEEVGSQFEAVPPHQLRAQTIMEWGMPVRIRIPEGLDLRPGELVDVRLHPLRETKPAKPTKSTDAVTKNDTT